jgi:hypothetical protein
LLCTHNGLKKVLHCSKAFWTKTLLCIQDVWTKSLLHTQMFEQI